MIFKRLLNYYYKVIPTQGLLFSAGENEEANDRN